MKRDIYIGDNLYHLRRSIQPATVDLVYLDPPFKSDRQYNMLFTRRVGARAAAQDRAFEDTWEWNAASDHACQVMTQTPGKLGEAIAALYRLLGEVPMMAYIAMMAPRLVELRRTMKPTASVYLHCDPTASHYLKILMDAIFGPEHFRSEIIWKRTSAHSSAKRYGPIHDVLLFYAKSDKYTWNQTFQPYDDSYLDQFYTHRDGDGRRWRRSDLTGAGVRYGETGKPWRGIDVTAKGRHWFVPPSELDKLDAAGKIHWPAKLGGIPMLRRYADEQPGVPLQDVWTDIPPLHNLAHERVGFQTQKPNALLKRIIEASSNKGDVILDPFCGCGTAIIVAEQLGRQWIGIDITNIALEVVAFRFKRELGSVPYVVKDIEPRALADAIALARKNRTDFETWALGLVGARPETPHRGADRGIDARFLDAQGRPVVVSVKSGKVTVSQVRDLRGVVEREQAVIGAFITLYQPTKAMVREAATAGAYETPTGLVPRIQILPIAQLLDANSRRLLYPGSDAVLTRRQPHTAREPDQFKLPLVTTVTGGKHSRLPRQEVPTAAPPRYATKATRLSQLRRGGQQLGMAHVEEAVPWQLARQPLSKAPSRKGSGKRRQRRAS